MITSDKIEYGIEVGGGINTVSVQSPTTNLTINENGNEITVSGNTSSITILSQMNNVSVLGAIYNINVSTSGGGGSGNSYFPSGW